MQSSIAPTAALSAANGDERSLNINFNLPQKVKMAPKISQYLKPEYKES